MAAVGARLKGCWSIGLYALLGGLNRAILGAWAPTGADAERRPLGRSWPSVVAPVPDDRIEKNCLKLMEVLNPGRS